MKSLLSTLNIETFVPDLAEPAEPKLDGLSSRMIDDTTLEVDLHKEAPVEDTFLSSYRAPTWVLRNKANRLEELFVHLVEKHRAKAR